MVLTEPTADWAIFIYENLPFLIPVIIAFEIYLIYEFFKPFFKKESSNLETEER